MIGSLANFSGGLKTISLNRVKGFDILVLNRCPPRSCVVKQQHSNNEGKSAECTTDSDSSLGSYT